MVSLRLQKRLAASLLTCGQRKVWLDPNEAADIANAKSRTYSYGCSFDCNSIVEWRDHSPYYMYLTDN